MVEFTDDIMDINPAERFERLRNASVEKKQTLASKKKEFDEIQRKKKEEIEKLEEKKRKGLAEIEEKRKELEALEKKKLEEIDFTEKLIEQSFQDLMRHKRKILMEEQENLEQMTKSSPSEENTSEDFRKVIEDNAPIRLYDVANRDVYTSLVGIRNRAASGEMTEEDEAFVESIRQNFERLESYVEKELEKDSYVKREKNILTQINTYIHR